MDYAVLKTKIDSSTGARDIEFYNYTVEKLKEANLYEMACIAIEICNANGKDDEKMKIVCEKLFKPYDESVYRVDDNRLIIFTLMNITKTTNVMNQIKADLRAQGIEICYGAVPQTDACGVDGMICKALNLMNEGKSI
ncbi:MAG: hypothetical protein MJ236_02035 [Clostridia bacterium]|nr:hypothetical protein [Clostridia bacterium]